jgi:lipoprotein-releasing system permease protein
MSKKSQKAINIISMITTVAVAVGTLALIVVLSVFNGFESLVIDMFNKFDPPLKASASKGKTIHYSDDALQKIRAIKGVTHASASIEENALVKYGERQFIATIKGVDSAYFGASGMSNSVTSGSNNIFYKGIPLAILGEGVADKLSVNFDNAIQPLNIYFPNKNNINNSLDLSSAFTFENISIGGTFSIQQEFDNKFIIVPKIFLDSLLDLNQQCTAIEILMSDPSKISSVKKSVQEILGNDFIVKDSEEQHEFIYKIMKAEKWAVFIILLFILMIATFNLTGALTMLIIDKQHDIFIMKSFGLMTERLKKIFIINGMLITVTGVVSGMLIGLGICFSQIQFGWLTFSGEGSFVVDAYPVEVKALDIFLISITVLVVGMVASIIPVNRIFRENKFNTVQQSI